MLLAFCCVLTDMEQMYLQTTHAQRASEGGGRGMDTIQSRMINDERLRVGADHFLRIALAAAAVRLSSRHIGLGAARPASSPTKITAASSTLPWLFAPI